MEKKVISKPKQRRSIATKKKIKVAAKALFSEQGYYKVTSKNIAVAAKVPIGSFYNYFGDKKGVLLELIKDFNTTFHATMLAPDNLPFEEALSRTTILEYITVLLRTSLLSANLSDPFYKVIHALQFTEPDVLALSEEIRVVEIQFLTQILEQIHPFQPISNIPLTAKLLHATSENLGLYIHHLGTDFEKEELIQEAAQMFYKYLYNTDS